MQVGKFFDKPISAWRRMASKGPKNEVRWGETSLHPLKRSEREKSNFTDLQTPDAMAEGGGK